MLKRNFFGFCATAAFLCSCTSAPVQSYRPSGSTDTAWQIDGDFNPLTKALKVRVNGQEVMAGALSFFGNSAELTGQYQSKPVSASCNQSMGVFTTKTQCIIFVNNERASTLQF